MYSDTIVAIATPPGEGGIGTVRLSGPASAGILRAIFVSASQPNESKVQNALDFDLVSHRLYYGHICDPATGDKVDEVLAVLMRAPHSYTREDVVEIDCHGGAVPLQRVMGLCLREGARLAQPGEFTLRAFLNGRLDLAQAEAVLDVVKARTNEGLKLAVEQLGGGVSARVKGIRARLLHALAHLEATIDFPEDDVPPADVSPDLLPALDDLRALVASASTGIVLRQGLRTAIAGRPNVGKSSLLNALLRTDRAIVTPIPGTTRDTLEEVANVRGVPLVLTDTAGLRAHADTTDPVERIGIDRTRRALSEADLVLMVFDGSQELAPGDLEVIRACEAGAGEPLPGVGGRGSGVGEPLPGVGGPGSENMASPKAPTSGPLSPTPVIAVINKSDLPQRIDLDRLGELLGDTAMVPASATEPDGTARLEEHLAQLVLSGKAVHSRDGGTTITSLRHRDALQRAEDHVQAALASIEAAMPAAFVAVDLHAALSDLGEITGETAGEDLLDAIFRNFCFVNCCYGPGTWDHGQSSMVHGAGQNRRLSMGEAVAQRAIVHRPWSIVHHL
jgi:tRNA modification GTPase